MVVQTLAKDKATDEHVILLVEQPAPVDTAIQGILAECTQCAASLDAILANIAHKENAHANSATLLTQPTDMSSPPPHPTSYVGAVYQVWGGARPLFLCGRLYHCLLSTAINQRYTSAPDLVVTLVNKIALAHPIQMMRCFPPTLNQHWGGLPRQCLHPPRCREQPLLVAPQ
jgi:hypothetical protein